MTRFISPTSLAQLITLFGVVLLPAQVFAQVDLGEDDEDAVSAESEAVTQDGEDAAVLEQNDGQGENLDVKEAKSESVEAPEEKKNQWYVGGRYRMNVVPKFLISAFGVEGGRTVISNSGGIEGGISIDERIDITFGVAYAEFGMEPTPFKGPSDPPEAWEIVESRLGQVFLSVDFDWRHKIVNKLDWTVGLGAGIGIVAGQLERWEAYHSDANGNPLPASSVTDPYTQLRPCVGPGNPDINQCPTDGHYGAGEAWPVYPWLTFQTGLRYQPHKNFIGRFLFGAGSTGFWFGLGADYGI